MKIVYLIQSETHHNPYTLPTGSDHILLNWKPLEDSKESDHLIHLPNSSWGEGRNTLYQRALELDDYDYFIFCDDDIICDFELTEFEQQLEQLNIVRATPNMNNNFYIDEPCNSQITALKYIDQCFMALSKQAANQLMPYTLDFDNECWWLTSEEFCFRCWETFPWQTLKLNRFFMSNTQNRSYPKSNYPGLPTNFFKAIA